MLANFVKKKKKHYPTFQKQQCKRRGVKDIVIVGINQPYITLKKEYQIVLYSLNMHVAQLYWSCF